MNHIAENNKVSQKGTKCCIARNIAIGTSSDNFPDICGRNDSVRSEMSEQREEYTRPPSYRKSERLTTPSNSPFKNEYTKILLKDFKHIFQGQLKPTLPTVKNSKDIIHDEKSKKYYKKQIDRPVKKETRSRKKQFKREKGKRNIRKHKKRTTSKRPKKEDMEENDSELELIGADNENLTSEDMSKDDTLQDVGDKEETKGQSSTSITRAEQDKKTKRNFPNVVISAKRVEPAAFNQALVLVDEFQNLFIK
ncbi:hypothetical protein M8J75_006340 [Diaphorina citri]|nr:hypothetical protein M8J75_006340 [Diaphorina citri]